MIKFTGILLLIVIVYSCGTSAKMVPDESTDNSEKTTGRYDESFDPLSLDDEDIIITRQEATELDPGSGKDKTKIKENKEVALLESEGFRVQIFATRGIETATLAQQKAIDQFSDSGNKVYLIFEAPLYRIRLGDALSRSDAEDIRDLAKERGYDEAFIVRSKVMVPENAGMELNEGF